MMWQRYYRGRPCWALEPRDTDPAIWIRKQSDGNFALFAEGQKTVYASLATAKRYGELTRLDVLARRSMFTA